ncbi:MAG: AMP-binding protein, partial [Bacilli bacterium]|nr:AMP-binding protein [Bacilli bacterium]
HVYGFVCSLLWGWSFGACVALGRGMRHMMDDPAFYKPTVATFVPQMAAFLSVHGLLNKELRLILIGAGDCSDEVLNGIKSKGIRVAFGYGMTETSSGVALSLGDDPRAMTVCPEFDVKLAEDGEILIHAPSTLMKGYLSEEGMVEPELEEGYFASGDLGSFDEGGRLHIIGRKKDILVLSDGTKIYCPEYEASLRNVIGNLDFAVFQDKSGKIDLAIGGTPRSEKIEDAVWRFNLSLSRGQQINKVYFVDAPLPKTATGKVRRYAIPDSIPKE